MPEFQFEENGKFVVVRCPKKLDSEAANSFMSQSKAWMLKPTDALVFDYKDVTEIGREYYKAVIQLKRALKEGKKQIYSLNLSKDLVKQIKKDGVEGPFNILDSLEKLSQATESSPRETLDASFINAFLVGAKKTMEVQCQTSVKFLKPYIKKESIPDIAVAAVLALSSDGFTGSIVICFPENVYLKVCGNMFSEQYSQMDPGLEDAAGEMLNIIYGIAKTELNEAGYNFQRAFPTVLFGEKLKFRQMGPQPAMVIPAEVENGKFYIEIDFNK